MYVKKNLHNNVRDVINKQWKKVFFFEMIHIRVYKCTVRESKVVSLRYFHIHEEKNLSKKFPPLLSNAIKILFLNLLSFSLMRKLKRLIRKPMRVFFWRSNMLEN